MIEIIIGVTLLLTAVTNDRPVETCTIDHSIDAVCTISKTSQGVMSMSCITRQGTKFTTSIPRYII